jgi:hypothetical protein
MPLRLNVGLTKKVGQENYGSKGASVNLEMELDGTLAHEPTKLKEKIGQLFALCRASLNDELNGGANGHAAVPATKTNGTGNGSSQPKHRPATQSQLRAIHSICSNKGIDLVGFLGGYGVDKAEDLSIKQASEIIDQLKK